MIFYKKLSVYVLLALLTGASVYAGEKRSNDPSLVALDCHADGRPVGKKMATTATAKGSLALKRWAEKHNQHIETDLEEDDSDTEK